MTSKRLQWDSFVDFVTVVWLFFFALGFIRPDLGSLCDTVNLGLLPVFIADLAFKYKKVGDLKIFIRHHWFDILIAVPYFRFLRALRILRAARVIKTAKIAKGGKVTKSAKSTSWIMKKTLKIVKAIKKLKRIFKV